MTDREEPGSGSLKAGLVALLSVCGIALAGFLYLRAGYVAFDQEIHVKLGASAAMKAASVATWRDERSGDAYTMAEAISLMPAAQNVLRGRARSDEKEQVARWLEAIRFRYNYEDVTLTGANGEAILSAGPAIPNEGVLRQATEQALAAGEKAYFGEFTQGGQDGEPRLNVSLALRGPGRQLLGGVVLGIDPEHEIYPSLRSWPGGGRSGRLQLVRRDGDSVVYLSELQKRGGGMEMLRLLLTSPKLAAAQAVRDRRDSIDGIDYRGVPVLASAREVPGTDWFMVAKIDREEALEPLRADTYQFLGFLAVVSLFSVTTVRLFVRRRTARFYRDKYAAEVERQELLGRYDFLARCANDAILVWEGAGRLLEVNDRAVEMFGYSRDELLHMSLLDLKPPESAADFTRFLTRVKEEGSLVFETVNRRKDGTSFPTEVSVGSIELKGKRYSQSIVRDASERVQAQLQIKRLNRLYAVLSKCDAASFRATTEDELFREVCSIVVNTGNFPVSWVGRVDWTAETVLPVATAGAQASYLDQVRIGAGSGPLGKGPTGAAIRTGKAVACADIGTDEAMAPWREAAERHGLRSSISLPLVRSGKTAYVLGIYSAEPEFFTGEEFGLAEEVGRSISFSLEKMQLERDRREAEAARQVSQERLELALDAANEAYWDWKVETDEWYWSPRMYQLTGLDPAEPGLGLEQMLAMVHPDELMCLKTQMEELLRGKLPSMVTEFRIRKSTGDYIWIQGAAKVVARDVIGRAKRVVGTGADITQRRLLEQQFLQAQKMETVGRLAGGVAHDFNNFLTVINGYASLLLSQLSPDSQMLKPLSEIRDAGERSVALTRQLLAFSRKSVESREAVRPNLIITGLEKILRRLMGEDVELRLELAPEPVQIMADPTHLEQVIMNLGTNARDAVQRHGTVRISTEKVSRISPATGDEQRFLRLTVADNGEGMSREVREHIFEPFFTTKGKAHGTGLGLATVYGIVDRSGGFIEVESMPGEGSSFHVLLPLVEAVEEERRPVNSTPVTNDAVETVMVAEDEDSVRGLTIAILERSGYRVLGAANGVEALRVAADYPGIIDAIVSDIVMPGMTGPEMVQKLLETSAGVRVMYVSGYAEEGVRQSVMEQPGVMFVSKPYAPAALTGKLRELLAGKEANHASQAAGLR